MGLNSLVSRSWDGRLPDAWRWLTQTALGMTETDWLDRNVPGWTSEADGIPKSVLYAGAGLEAAEVDQLGDWRRLALGNARPPDITLMDTTTLYTAYRMLTDDDPRAATPLTIIDLSTFLTAFCVYNRVCFLQNRYITAAELNGLFQREVFCELPVTDTVNDPDIAAICGDINRPLKSLYEARAVPWLSDLRAGRFGTGEQRDSWVRSWETILGHRCNADWLLRDPNEGGSHLYTDTWDSPARDLLQNLVDVTGGTGPLSPGLAEIDHGRAWAERSGRVRLAQESNARAIYNLVLADFLAAPYSASIARLPILHLMAGAAETEMRELMQLPRGARELNRAFDNKAAQVLTGERGILRLPFFPTAILHKANQRHDIASVAGDVRDKGAAFRLRLAELNQQLDDQQFSAVDEIRRMLEPTTRNWDSWITAAEAGSISIEVVSLVQEPHLNALVLFAVLLKGAFAGGLLADLIRRRARPRYGTFSNLVLTPDVGSDVERLWHISDSVRFTERIQELATLSRPHAA